jgi:hypothetical protein
MNGRDFHVKTACLFSCRYCALLIGEASSRQTAAAVVRPRWYSQSELLLCGLVYVGLSRLVFISTQLPMLRAMLR